MRTRSASVVIPGRLRPFGRASGCATRCAHGSSCTAGHPLQRIGLARTPIGAAAKHSNDFERKTGLPLQPSSTSTGPGPRLTLTRSPTADGQLRRGPSAETPGTYQTRCPAGFPSATRQPTATRRRSTAGTSCWSPTPPSCSLSWVARTASSTSFRDLLRLVGVRYLRCVVVVLRVARVNRHSRELPSLRGWGQADPFLSLRVRARWGVPWRPSISRRRSGRRGCRRTPS